jgi:hypothetical protein
VQVGVKTECKIYGCRFVKMMWISEYTPSHTGVKLGAKQLNIFRSGCKTTIFGLNP